MTLNIDRPSKPQHPDQDQPTVDLVATNVTVGRPTLGPCDHACWRCRGSGITTLDFDPLTLLGAIHKTKGNTWALLSEIVHDGKADIVLAHWTPQELSRRLQMIEGEAFGGWRIVRHEKRTRLGHLWRAERT